VEVVQSPRDSSKIPEKGKTGIPVLAIALYYLGVVTTSLGVGNTGIFLIQIVFFPLIFIAGLVLKYDNVVIIGLVIMIVGTVGH
jgi:hypothetical protein